MRALNYIHLNNNFFLNSSPSQRILINLKNDLFWLDVYVN